MDVLRDAIAMPLVVKLESGSRVKYVQPSAFTTNNEDAFYSLQNMIDRAKRLAEDVDFVDERTANKIKINLNHLIRQGRVIDGDVFEDAGLCSASLIDLWHTVSEIKLHALDLCEDDADFDTYVNYNEPTQGEGYVMVTRFGYFKLVDRSAFSYSNFNNDKFAVAR